MLNTSKQIRVSGRVCAVDPTREDCNRSSTGRQRRLVCDCFNTVGTASDNDTATEREVTGEFNRHVVPIRGGSARTGQRDEYALLRLTHDWGRV